MRTVSFEHEGETFVLPQFGELPLRCFKDRRYATLVENAPDGFLDFMWDMSADEARVFVRSWTAASREIRQAETPQLAPIEQFMRWADRHSGLIAAGTVACIVLSVALSVAGMVLGR